MVPLLVHHSYSEFNTGVKHMHLSHMSPCLSVDVSWFRESLNNPSRPPPLGLLLILQIDIDDRLDCNLMPQNCQVQTNWAQSGWCERIGPDGIEFDDAPTRDTRMSYWKSDLWTHLNKSITMTNIIISPTYHRSSTGISVLVISYRFRFCSYYINKSKGDRWLLVSQLDTHSLCQPSKRGRSDQIIFLNQNGAVYIASSGWHSNDSKSIITWTGEYWRHPVNYDVYVVCVAGWLKTTWKAYSPKVQSILTLCGCLRGRVITHGWFQRTKAIIGGQIIIWDILSI